MSVPISIASSQPVTPVPAEEERPAETQPVAATPAIQLRSVDPAIVKASLETELPPAPPKPKKQSAPPPQGIAFGPRTNDPYPTLHLLQARIGGGLQLRHGDTVNSDTTVRDGNLLVGGEWAPVWGKGPRGGFALGASYLLQANPDDKVHRLSGTVDPILRLSHLAVQAGVRPRWNASDTSFELGVGGNLSVFHKIFGGGVFVEALDFLEADPLKDGIALGVFFGVSLPVS